MKNQPNIIETLAIGVSDDQRATALKQYGSLKFHIPSTHHRLLDNLLNLAYAAGHKEASDRIHRDN